MAPKRIATALAGIVALAAMLVAASCGASRPVSYYTLDSSAVPVPAPAPGTNNDARLPLTIVVGRISAAPLYLDTPIVYSTSDVEMGTYEYHRWAEAPTQMLETMLTRELRDTGRFRSVARLGGGATGDYVLRGHLYALEEEDSPSLRARFSLELDLFDPKTRTVVWTQTYHRDDPVSRKNVSAIVETLHQEVAAGIGQLTANLVSYLSNLPAR
ncbi:MAG TPA: ABC-type transport auxiliary lipoprotein family protein [Candidatus Dormibacteraeota bacterium]|nr:ABC-type transport auxiliary lipoprotein family protein [Candidatus Dormibacteraeota bacterium]